MVKSVSVAGRLNAHYLFLACTPFLYDVGAGQEYHVDAVYLLQGRCINRVGITKPTIST